MNKQPNHINLTDVLFINSSMSNIYRGGVNFSFLKYPRKSELSMHLCRCSDFYYFNQITFIN